MSSTTTHGTKPVSAARPLREVAIDVHGIEPYVPGEFYRRELPCIEAMLAHLGALPTLIVVDGYVDLGPGHPGLGRHLFERLNEEVPVIGVAKTHFHEAPAAEVLRGESKNPLYVTAAGMSLDEAADWVSSMAGPHRIPHLLKRVDQIARGAQPEIW